ncbi:MAG: hypothetical protein IH576_01830 [Deltaproteobacteria bacterium]|nr:hypothetical protein [Deltaproteobacteria bacterium]
MERIFLAVLLAVLLSAGCMVAPGHRGSGVLLVPPLPAVVVLEDEPYYYHNGYHYYYQRDRWSYSNSRNGPWAELPRDRYPKELRYRGRGETRGYDRYGR